VPETDSCATKCDTGCTAGCTAQANASCQVECQEESFPECSSDYVQLCSTQCAQPEGALFCDGNYVDVGGDLPRCVEALNEILDSKIPAPVTPSEPASADPATRNPTCAASRAPAPGGSMAAVCAVLVMATVSRARRRKRSTD
jgi:hypothetical protein